MARNKARYTDQVQNGPMFTSVATKTTGNETLANVGQTINGHTVAAGDRILVTEQTTTTEDGIYIAVDGGAWVRSEDAFVGENAGGRTVIVEQGTDANTEWIFTNNTGSGVIGTDDLTVSKISAGLLPTEVFDEEPSVTNGSPTVTLAQTPDAGTLRLYLNGVRMREGSGNDYTVSGNTVTFEYNLKNNPGNPDHVQADYQYT